MTGNKCVPQNLEVTIDNIISCRVLCPYYSYCNKSFGKTSKDANNLQRHLRRAHCQQVEFKDLGKSYYFNIYIFYYNS